MIAKVFSAHVFSLIFGLGYAFAVYLDHPLFRYYPLMRRWSLHDLVDRSLGPAMSWYGWIATAAIPAVLAAALVPKDIGNRIPAAVYWFVPFAMLLAGWHHERAWFL